MDPPAGRLAGQLHARTPHSDDETSTQESVPDAPGSAALARHCGYRCEHPTRGPNRREQASISRAYTWRHHACAAGTARGPRQRAGVAQADPRTRAEKQNGLAPFGANPSISLLVVGAAGRIRTHDPLVRSQVLYPTELQPLMLYGDQATGRWMLPVMISLLILVRLAGFEPTTPWFVAKYSIQLSYSR